MKAAQYAKYFIRAILLMAFIALVLTAIHILTPKIDVFSFVGVHWDADHPKEISYSFNREELVQEILKRKPNANTEDVEEFANSIQIELEIVDWIEDVDDPRLADICMRIIRNCNEKLELSFTKLLREWISNAI